MAGRRIVGQEGKALELESPNTPWDSATSTSRKRWRSVPKGASWRWRLRRVEVMESGQRPAKFNLCPARRRRPCIRRRAEPAMEGKSSASGLENVTFPFWLTAGWPRMGVTEAGQFRDRFSVPTASIPGPGKSVARQCRRRANARPPAPALAEIEFPAAAPLSITSTRRSRPPPARALRD